MAKRKGIAPARSTNDPCDPFRLARYIVRIAASQSKGSTKRWFVLDEHGKWEQRAADYLSRTALAAAEKNLSCEQVNNEIATMLRLLSVEAQIHRRGKR